MTYYLKRTIFLFWQISMFNWLANLIFKKPDPIAASREKFMNAISDTNRKINEHEWLADGPLNRAGLEPYNESRAISDYVEYVRTKCLERLAILDQSILLQELEAVKIKVWMTLFDVGAQREVQIIIYRAYGRSIPSLEKSGEERDKALSLAMLSAEQHIDNLNAATGSLIDDFADVSTIMPSYMDPED